MEQTCIATFFSHFGAIRFSKELKAKGIPCRLMPVPRRVSSSCGTCVQFTAENGGEKRSEEMEQLFLSEGSELTLLWSQR